MTKAEIIKIVNTFPEDVTLEEAIYRLYMENEIQQGLKDIESGRIKTQNEVRNIFG